MPRCNIFRGKIADAIKSDPDVTGVVSVIGSGSVNPTTNVGRLVMSLKPRGDRRDDVAAVIVRLKQKVAPIPGMTVYFQPVQDVQISTESSRSQYQYTLTGTDAALVTQWANKLVAELRRDPLFRDVSSEAQEGGLRAQLDVDRQRAGPTRGVSLQVITDTLNDAFAQRQISTIYGQANQYRVVLEALPMYQRDPSVLSKLYVPGAAQRGGWHAGGAGADIGGRDPEADHGAARYLASGAVPCRRAQVSISQPTPPSVMPSKRSGRSKPGSACPPALSDCSPATPAEFSKSLAGQPWLILAAIVTIYIVLGVLYESYIHPITILSTLPSAGVGAILALILFGQDLSVIGLIGIILLMGIVKKNAIMMIDFALEAERHQGLSAADAIVQACCCVSPDHDDDARGAVRRIAARGRKRHRRRVAVSAGHFDHRRLAAEAQLLTLYTTPVIYLALDRINRRIEKAAPPPAPGLPRPPAAGCDRGRAIMDAVSISEPFIRPSRRHHLAGDRAVSGRRGRLRIPARRLGA